MTSLTVGLSRQAGDAYRFAYPVQHEGDWISPFIAATPTQADDKDYKKITIANETGEVKERYFKKIDTTNWEDPIAMDGTPWPADRKEIRILSCCHVALKVNTMINCLQQKDQCPFCQAQTFINELGDTITPAPVAAPGVGPGLYGGPWAPPAPAVIRNIQTHRLASISLVAGVAIFYSNLLFSKIQPILLSASIILVGSGIILKKLSILDPQDPFRDKIRMIVKEVLVGATLNGLGSLLIAGAIKYTLLTSVLIGSGAFITTIALAALYVKLLR